jgi:hypothetical protein
MYLKEDLGTLPCNGSCNAWRPIRQGSNLREGRWVARHRTCLVPTRTQASTKQAAALVAAAANNSGATSGA